MEILELNKSHVKRIELNGARFYELDNIVYPSVTSILDIIQPKRLTNYFKNNSKAKIEKTLTTTADFGSSLHSIIEMDLKGNPPTFSDSQQPLSKCYDNWKIIKERHNISAIKSEQIVVSKKYGFAGQYDHWGLCDGTHNIIDVKSGFFSNKVGLQMAAYRQALIENEPLTPKGISELGLVGIQIHRDGREPKVFKYEHLSWVMTKFLHALEIWKHENFQMLNKIEWPYLHKDSVKEYYESNK